MTVLSAHQPVYLPGIILFNKIALSDVFVLLSHVQFERSSWQMRNRVRCGAEACYLSIPVRKKGLLGQSIAETAIDGDAWKAKHLKTLFFNYNKRPFFGTYFPEIESILQAADESLCALNKTLIEYFCRVLGLNPKIIDSKDIAVNGVKNEMLIDICRTCGASDYVSNLGAASYINEDAFAAAGIRHRWQGFHHPIYAQGTFEFVSNLSIVDLLFNVGPEAGAIVRNAGTLEGARPTVTTSI
ncbi:MAG: WbqC family protein [Pseudolabrys sp.]|nr:WbqC family protein [Pseudolabrys sp.]